MTERKTIWEYRVLGILRPNTVITGILIIIIIRNYKESHKEISSPALNIILKNIIPLGHVHIYIKWSQVFRQLLKTCGHKLYTHSCCTLKFLFLNFLITLKKKNWRAYGFFLNGMFSDDDYFLLCVLLDFQHFLEEIHYKIEKSQAMCNTSTLHNVYGDISHFFFF